MAAVIVSFHYLFAVILPALLVGFFIVKSGNRKGPQFGVAIAIFTLAFLPIIPGLLFLLHTTGTHVYTPPPPISSLIWTLAPGLLLYIFGGAAVAAGILAAYRKQHDSQGHIEGWRILLCASLALIPLLILFGISAATPMHIFLSRYCLVAVPGIALCWTLLIERYLNTRPVRLLFCVVLVAVTAFQLLRSPAARDHSFTRKYALAAAEKNASVDNAPVLVCSGFIESRYRPMPLHSAKESWLFAPLSYYKLTVPVVPLPWGFNEEAKRVGSQFLKQATQKHQRFLAIASDPSYETLDWLSKQASPSYNVHSLGTFDTVKVFEFTPRTPATPPAAHSSDQPPPPSVKAASTPATP
jgi:hypothetical protein